MDNVSSITYVYEVTKIERTSNQYGHGFSMKVEAKSIGLFSSKDNAELAIAKCVKDVSEAKGWAYDLVGFYVEKYQLDRTLSAPDTWSSISEENWSYTKDGKQLSYSPFSSDWKDGKYLGTDPENIKFKVGDYVWAYMCGRFVPAKVCALPYTPEEWAKKFNFASDASDDCYLVMCPNGHDHPQTIDVFPMDRVLPKAVIDAIEACSKEYYGN